jgi:hypothetical protein
LPRTRAGRRQTTEQLAPRQHEQRPMLDSRTRSTLRGCSPLLNDPVVLRRHGRRSTRVWRCRRRRLEGADRVLRPGRDRAHRGRGREHPDEVASMRTIKLSGRDRRSPHRSTEAVLFERLSLGSVPSAGSAAGASSKRQRRVGYADRRLREVERRVRTVRPGRVRHGREHEGCIALTSRSPTTVSIRSGPAPSG